MKEVFDQIEAEVDQHAVDKKCDEIERKNLLLENENLIAECLSKDVFYTVTNYMLTVSRFFDMHDAYTAAQKHIAELKAENSSMKNKIQNDDHDEMIKHLSKIELEHLNLQLKYQHLKEHFGNKKSVTSLDVPAFDSVFVIGQLEERLQGRGNTIRELKEKISRLTKKNNEAHPMLDFKASDSQNKDLTVKVNALQDLNEHFREENEKIKQHYKELYDSIKITHAKTIEKTTSLLDEIENPKAQLKGKMKCVTMPFEKPKVLAPATLREMVEEARVEKPLDSSIAFACLYTKHSQDLLEYVIGIKDATAASGSKPRSNTKKDRTLPAKSDMQEVEDHPRNNKSSMKRKNRVDSSISYKRTVINLNSNYVCKTCNKSLMSGNHDKCVVK
ncbi:hypothetical protein Tco_0151803 [Tanacetum coccineum]